MKKLMIAAAIVCAAVVSQAASITWGSKNIYDGTGTSGSLLAGTDAYLFSAVQYIGEVDPGTGKKTAVTLTTAKIIEALGGVGAEDANTWLASLTKIDTAVGSGSDAGKVQMSTTGTVDPSTAGLVAGAEGKQTLFMLVFDTDSVTDASKFYIASTEKEVADSGNTSFAFGSQTTSSQNGDNWHSVAGAVPEPTSGLLLLLGVAGLALRRRRA